MKKPLLILTTGDPAGIGPEISIKTSLLPEVNNIANVLLWGSSQILQKAVDYFTPKVELVTIKSIKNIPKEFKKNKIYCHNVLDLPFSSIKTGEISKEAGKAAYKYINTAASFVFEGHADAIVTAPVNKQAINLAGIPFTGHTELVAEICKVRNFAMMQSDGNLRIIFVTTHDALNDVSQKITKKRLSQIVNLLNDVIKLEGISSPKIAISALNPHAGEGGYMGKEEIEIIIPAIKDLQQEGLNLEGPFPPDTLFVENIRNKFDGIVTMYHDQGHIPFKMLAFDTGVNSTLGLPIIRTSVDHGTAFNIAWKGIADTGSLKAACITAAKRAIGKQL